MTFHLSDTPPLTLRTCSTPAPKTRLLQVGLLGRVPLPSAPLAGGIAATLSHFQVVTTPGLIDLESSRAGCSVFLYAPLSPAGVGNRLCAPRPPFLSWNRGAPLGTAR